MPGLPGQQGKAFNNASFLLQFYFFMKVTRALLEKMEKTENLVDILLIILIKSIKIFFNQGMIGATGPRGDTGLKNCNSFFLRMSIKS